MTAWNRTGPVVVEVDGTAENLRVVDYAAAEAAVRSRTGAGGAVLGARLGESDDGVRVEAAR